ncbi:MAG: hypothetical protein ACXVIG_04430 [Halobacteriota archaeon]
MATPQPSLRMMYAGIGMGFAWLLFVALWLIFYASGFSILQNIGIFVLSVVVIGALEALLWVPWSMKHAF